MRIDTYTILAVLLAIVLAGVVGYTAYREEYRFYEKGTLYVLDAYMSINYIGDYGVISAYLKPEGVYGYGFTLLKDPDEPLPHLYVMLGTQNEWYSLGLLNDSTIRFRLVIDTTTKYALVIYRTSPDNYTSREYRLSEIPSLKSLYLAVFNITGRSHEYPVVRISYIHVFVSNKTLEEVEQEVRNMTLTDLPGSLALSVENLSIGIATSTTRTTTETIETITTARSTTTPQTEIATSSPEIEPIEPVVTTETTYVVYIVIGATITLLVIVFLLKRRAERGSPGP
ncbi:MAG: hypothetical protein ABWW65_07570 [Thermoprotei archaeon]